MSEQRETLAEALWRQFGYPSEGEWEELLNEDRDDWRADAQTLLASDALEQMLVEAEQRGADRVAAAVEALALNLDRGDSIDRGIATDLRAALATGAADRVRAEEGER